MRPINLDGIHAFVLVAACGSFRAAAQVMCADESTVRKLVDRLERDLGAPLLARSTRRLGLTQAGEECLGTARRLLALSGRIRERAQAT